jgi:hypothetical protein
VHDVCTGRSRKILSQPAGAGVLEWDSAAGGLAVCPCRTKFVEVGAASADERRCRRWKAPFVYRAFAARLIQLRTKSFFSLGW